MFWMLDHRIRYTERKKNPGRNLALVGISFFNPVNINLTEKSKSIKKTPYVLKFWHL